MDTAESLARTVLSLPAVIPWYTSMARAALALLAVQRHDTTGAHEQYTALQSVPGIMILYVSTDRALGLLAQTMGEVDPAMAHFEDALAFCRRAGYRPELAWTCCDYADALLHPWTGPGRVSPGDRPKGMALLEEALAISRELGMRPLMERATDRLERMKSVAHAAPVYPDGLTQREVEVLRLIALGKSNREIAEELVLSIRTVERHITNIYAKINARGRAGATAYALSHGLAGHL